MQIARNKTMATLIALFLMSAMTISLFALPNANAVVSSRKSYAVIGATPNPVGVGQETLILMGLTQQLNIATEGWQGLTVTVNRPDGTTETLGPYKSDSTGLTGGIYVPSMVGNYTLQVNFPAQWYNSSTALTTQIWQEATTSIQITLVVQQEPLTYFPAYPLPTEYWTRPIDDQLREWAPIAGNWLTTPRNFFAVGNDYAPESAHILWVTPLTSGGLVGGPLNTYDATDQVSSQVGYETGDAYEGKWSGSLIMGGKLYYQKYASADPYKEIVCVDLHTGEQLWSRVLLGNLTLSRGQMHYWQTYDNQGVYDYLWASANTATLTLLGLNSTYGTTWCAFDPFTGDYVYTLYSMPSGTFDYGPKGEMLYYNLNMGTLAAQQTGWMTLWNSTNIPALYASRAWASMAWGQWQPMGKIVNATGIAGVTYNGVGFPNFTAPTLPLNLNGYQWNVTIPKGLQGSVRAVFEEDRVVGAAINQTDVVAWGIDLRPGKEGQLLFNEAWKAPAEWAAGNLSVSLGTISAIDGVFTVNTKEDRLRYGFSTKTGKYLWVISEPIAMLGHLTGGPSGEGGYIAYGMLYCGTMSGIIQAFDVTTGKLAWKYDVRDPYMQVLWSNNWPVGHLIVADGKIYFANLEHSVNQPLPRGGPFVCLNATTGEVIWRVNGLFRQTVWGGRAVMGDSIIATMDTYDQRIYAIGKGPSATTVSIQNDVTTLGSSVMIKGTVTDTSPGTKKYALTARFPNGVPAVSDESMSDWMLYVYAQFPRPANATGVEVSLDTIDPNGNWIHIGTATSDSSGMFSYQWTPDVPGKYTVIATFAGTNSYYASYSETAVGVDEAPPVPAAPEPAPPLPPYETYTIGTGIAIIAAVAIVGLMILRKKP